MRKRRVFALLLAFSLVVSGNGMTVLAQEQGADMPVSISQEETPGPDVSKGEEGQQDENQEPAENVTPENPETPKPDAPKGEEGQQDENQEPEEDVTPENPETPKPDAPEGEEPGKEETPKEEEPSETPEPEAPVEEPEKEPEPEVPEVKSPEVKPYVSRMVTFTDDIGMKITYDANASLQYIYKVEGGVLKAVVTKSTTTNDDGETVEAENPVSFEGNVELKQPEEGEQYTSIDPGVFGGNQKITYVKLPAGITAVAANSFKGCTGLKSVYLPSSVSKIEESAFEGCTSMTQISVPKAVTAIGASAFKRDARLHLVYIKDVDYSELETIGAGAFEGCTVLSEFCADTHFAVPNRVKSIGASAFKGCKAIKAVDFKNTKLAELGESAFEGCRGMESLSMGNKLALISRRAFADCQSLVAVTFPVVGSGVKTTIDEGAFSGCYSLKQLVLPQYVEQVNANAFQGCTNLTRVELRCDGIALVKESFPIENESLVIIATSGSTGDEYAMKYKKKADKDRYYTYKVEDIEGNEMSDGKFPGGTLWVGTADKNKYEENINKLNKGQGVKSDDTRYYIYQTTKEGYTFIADSLRCNGQPVQRENGKYYFSMPEGGAVITAEFRADVPDKIKGLTVAVEFSAGVPIQNGAQDDKGYLGVELKLGQTTKLYVLDEDGESIPAAKLKLSSRNKNIATIDSRGVITAVGTGSGESASTQIEIKAVGGDGKEIVFTRTVSVKTAEAKSISLKAQDYKESQVVIEEKQNGLQTASIDRNYVDAGDLRFTLKANVYDGEDAIGKKLTWTTSDSRVAVLASSSTEAKDPTNEVTVKKKCEGETTITVTANNAAGSEKEKVVQKFVIRVYQEGYRLSAASVTVNPNEMNGGMIELLSTSGASVDQRKIKLYEENTLSNTPFTVVEANQTGRSESSYKKFYIKPDTSNIKNGTYKVRVGVDENRNQSDFIPLKITVKRTTPTPTIKFNSKRTKFNLFYKNGGVDADGNQTVVTTEITKLGDAKIGRVALEPLSQKEDDKLFLENFEIDSAQTDLAAGKVIIRRKDGNLKYTSKKAAAVTGYLAIYYEGFEDSAAKKMKVTMPTCNTAPSFALRTTKATYRTGCGEMEELLELYDKKSKTKEKAVLDAESYTVTEEKQDIVLSSREYPKIEDGSIALKFTPEKGAFKLVLRNKNWDLDKNGKERTLSFTYTVSVSNTKPTVKTDKASVSLNLNYPETEAAFTLTSNQRGLCIEGNQTFHPVPTRSNAGEIGKLAVTYQNGEGKVRITDKTLKKGSYKFECNPQADWPDLKKVSLTVKVVDTKPTVKLGRGAMQLNLVAFRNNSSAVVSIADQTVGYREITQLSFKVSGVPDGYALADVGTGSGSTTVTCKNRPGAEKQFDFQVTAADPEKKLDNMLSASLNSAAVAAGTYSFTVTPAYQREGMTTVYAKPFTVSVKVYSSEDIKLTLKAGGKINLLNREGEADAKNGIIYTPSLQNLKGEITDVRIYDGGSLEKESEYFDIQMITEGKNKGKFFVTPKKTVKKPEASNTPEMEAAPTAETPVEYDYAALEYNKNYPVRIWVKVKGYAGKSSDKNGVISKTVQIKASQVLPKTTLSKKELDVYLSTKNYDASFVVSPKSGSVGTVEKVYFGEKDEKALESFELLQEPQEDGSLKVIVHLQEGVEYPKDSLNTVKLYVKYKGQGENTPESATTFSMKIKVN